MSDIPVGLVLGWAIWLAGGLALMLWFRRRSAPPTVSAAHATGRAAPLETRRSAPRSAATRTPAPRDAFSDLQSLLDQPEDRRVG